METVTVLAIRIVTFVEGIKRSVREPLTSVWVCRCETDRTVSPCLSDSVRE
jgi:hypothetical protein